MIKHHQKTKVFAATLGLIAVMGLITVQNNKFYSVQAASFNVECASTDPAAPTEINVGLYDNTSDLTLDEPVGGGTGYCKLSGDLDVNSLTISADVVLTHDDEDTDGINITASTMTVDGEVNVDGRGCGGGTQSQNARGPNPVSCALNGSGAGLTANGGGGGGHGGDGGASGFGSGGGTAYGSNTNPVLLGAGGAGSGSGFADTAGGGLIILDISGTLTINGEISADGLTGDTGTVFGVGGGSGGSINITVGTIGGSGSISAIGGDGDYGGNDSVDGGGGSGGRIAINYGTELAGFVTGLDVSTVAAGGASDDGPVSEPGEDGTLYANQLTSVEFDSTTSSIVEDDSGTQAHTITINSSTNVSGDTDVDYSVTGGTATGAGTDYTLADGTVTILDGTSTITFDATINGDELDESDETIIIELSGPTNGAILGSNTTHTVTITDDDTSGVSITESDETTEVTEGGATDTIEVVLDTMPLGDVVITPSSANGDVEFTPATLTFTDANYSTPQTITVSATDDDLDEDNTENDTISFAISSGVDGVYDALDLSGEDITAVVTDDDTAGATLTESDDSSAATEGATDTFTLVLDTEPTADVTVTIATDAQSSVDTETVTFTTENWDTPQEVTITAVDDEDIEEDTHTSTISFTFESLDANFDAYELADLTFTITENDVAQSGGGSSGGRASGSLGGPASTGDSLSNLLGNGTADSVDSSNESDEASDKSNSENSDDSNSNDSSSGNGSSSGSSNGEGFSDTNDHWAKDHINSLVKKGIFEGKDAEEFKPEDKATRAEALKVVMVAFQDFDEANFAFQKQIFNDVETDHWAYKYIQEAFNLGIVQGYEDNTFKPNEEISRQEALTLILKAASLNSKNVELSESVNFTDIEEAYWGYEDILVAYSMGIINGYPDGEFKPSKIISRAELAKITALTVSYLENL